MFPRRLMLFSTAGAVALAPLGARAQTAANLRDLADTLAADSRFTTFLDLITRAGLVESLKGSAPTTVFAPANDSFNRSVPAGLLTELVSPPAGTGERGAPDPRLRDLINFHIVRGRFGTQEFTRGTVVDLPTVNGAALRMNAQAGIMELAPAAPPGANTGGFGAAGIQVQNQTAKIVQADILASNGVIHVIDRVLFPG
jgi:uncharacterized surface protein with fasciclin (FAS1) repeats